MAKLSAKQKDLLEQLESVSNQLDTLLGDETVKSLPKALDKIKDQLDDTIQKLEDGEFQDESDE